jgi:hypothetical protein
MQFCTPSQAAVNKIGFVACSLRLFPHTDTPHQPVEIGKKAGEMTFFHNHQRVFMQNEIGRAVHDHHSLLR